jgi:hypothetical protein
MQIAFGALRLSIKVMGSKLRPAADARWHGVPFETKMDAEAWLAAERRSIERDEWQPPSLRVAEKKAKGVSVVEYAHTWIEQRNVKPRTRSGYHDLLRLHIGPMLGKVPLKNLTRETVRGWYSMLGTDHPRRNSHAYGLLHAICATAVSDGLIVSNPCTITGVMNPPRRRDPLILSVAEVAALADIIKPDRLKALVLLSAWCGVRWGEVSELASELAPIPMLSGREIDADRG